MPEVEMIDEEVEAQRRRETDPAARASRHAAAQEEIAVQPVNKVGRSAQRRQRALLSMRKKLERETRRMSDGTIEGPLRPCTIVNFNPLPLVSDIQGRRVTIPDAAHTTARFHVKLTHAGRKYVGAYTTFNNPILYTPVEGHEVDEVLPIDVPKTRVEVITPHALGCIFWNEYNSPSLKLMGGMLLFDGDFRAISGEAQERSDGRILVPERMLIEDGQEYAYGLREALLEEELDRIFEVQRDYANTQVQMAHTLWTTNEPTQQAMITDTMRDWARFAHAMHYGLTDLPAWVTAKLNVSGPLVDLPKCRACQKQARDAGAYFCECGVPYNAFKAFQAGLHVPMQYLELLEGDELEQVQAEMARRRRKFAGLGTSGQDAEAPPADGKAQKPLTGAAAAAAAKKAQREAASSQGKEPSA